MKEPERIYKRYFEIEDQNWMCERCNHSGEIGTDLNILRINGSLDKITNLVCLCGKCESDLSEGKLGKELYQISNICREA